MTTTRSRALDAGDLASARREWRGGAARAHFGTCAACGRLRTDDDRPLWVVRAERSRRFLCFDCWAVARLPRRRTLAA
jgi:hypothetical protein